MEGGVTMNNAEIRISAKNSKVKMWQVAEALGIQDSALSRKMRHELPAAEKAEIMEIISKLAKEVGRCLML